jgi:hypothetical protein
MRQRPNPARFLLLLIVIILSLGAGFFGGTGGVDPSWLVQDDSVSASITVGLIIGQAGWPLLAVFSVGLGFAVILARPGGVLAGLRFALGSNRPEVCRSASRALAVGSRAVTWGGVCVGVGGCGVVGGMIVLVHYLGVVRVDPDTYMNIIWMAMGAAVIVPHLALALGRVGLGSLADGARIRGCESGGPAFGPRQDFALATVIVAPLFYLLLITLS